MAEVREFIQLQWPVLSDQPDRYVETLRSRFFYNGIEEHLTEVRGAWLETMDWLRNECSASELPT